MTKTILLVEDDKTILGLMHTYLHDSGFQVILTDSEKQAIAAMHEVRPDLIFLDYLGEAESRSICQKARAFSLPVPIVLFTARSRSEEIANRLETSLLRKPFDLMELDFMLTSFLSDSGVKSEAG